jgi:SAM-dependent methyltransferase
MHSRTTLVLKLLRAGLDPAQIITRLELREALRGCESVLDVGCGPNSTLRWFGFKHLAGIEGYPPSVEEAQKNQTHDEVILGDVRELERFFRPGQFDACVALDVIEHLPKEDGLKMTGAMERVATKKVVLLTPNGFLPQRHTENDDLQEHLSGWDAAEMKQRGYRVIGILGPKRLREEYHRLRHRPKIFWGVVSLLGHFICTRWCPGKAAAILCINER